MESSRLDAACCLSQRESVAVHGASKRKELLVSNIFTGDGQSVCVSILGKAKYPVCGTFVAFILHIYPFEAVCVHFCQMISTLVFLLVPSWQRH